MTRETLSFVIKIAFIKTFENNIFFKLSGSQETEYDLEKKKIITISADLFAFLVVSTSLLLCL